MTDLAIRAEQVTRTYKYRTIKRELKVVEALAGVDLQVKRGELFGLLGPNGAGKTTLIKILTTLLAPSSGRAWVEGLDVVRDYQKIRPLINMVAGGENTGYGLLTVRENLWMFAQFYGLDSKTTRVRTDELLKMLNISDQANTKVSHLSTGMRQKMNFARGFITDPQIVFLDEPTLGLDVSAARDVRRYIKEWTTRTGKTTLLTTHYMAEADELCDRIAIINKGRIIACDTPNALKRQLQSESVFELRVAGAEPAAYSAQIGKVAGVQKVTTALHDGYTDVNLILNQETAIGPIVSTLSGEGASILNLSKREPTLEDVFVMLVGRGLAEDTNESPS
ncbi:MAG: ABC transporter ATP-binding protein [Chloroflexi bacterium]|nr:ABC transporter ATP-binding protein [Chloroflexota bacterium]